jgi:heme/copper-type cytochrome/quinol oxidase subunit 2
VGALAYVDPASNWLVAIIELSDAIIFWLIIILGTVIWFMVSTLAIASSQSGHATGHFSHLAHGNPVELIWTVTPALILWAIYHLGYSSYIFQAALIGARLYRVVITWRSLFDSVHAGASPIAISALVLVLGCR